MSWLKIVGGALAGVGAVVALPVAGPIGAVSLGGAAIAAAIGGAVGATSSDNEGKAALKDERAEQKERKERLKVHDEHMQETLGLFALGMAAANCDGNISKNEEVALDTFCKSLAEYPKEVEEAFNKIRQSKPNLKTSMEMIFQSTYEPNWEAMEEIVLTVVEATRGINKNEAAFIAVFQKYKQAA
jgi:hypothetical protein